MPSEILSMRVIRDVLRLKYGNGLSERAISVTLGISKGAIGSYLSSRAGGGAVVALAGRIGRTRRWNGCCFPASALMPRAAGRCRSGRRWSGSCAGAA